ncbi:hypothetical protein ACV33P_31715, partial [Pseudomonas aeruginosa]
QTWFIDDLVPDFDYVVCLTVDSLRSPIFEHATQASFGLLQHYHERRHAAGIAGPFTLRVLDSHSVFAGIAETQLRCQQLTRLYPRQGIAEQLLRRLLEARRERHRFVLAIGQAEHRLDVEQLSQQTCTYLV